MEEVIVKIMEILASAEAMSVTVAIILEFILRMIPSQKPLSILHVAAKVIRSVSVITEKVADLLDRWLPQKTSPKAE